MNVVGTVQGSWARGESSLRTIAAELPMEPAVSVRSLTAALTQPESRTFVTEIHTDDSAPINGAASIELRSDGTVVTRGHMRATGGISYDYALDIWLRLPGGAVIAAVRSGSVYGSDTPGRRQDEFTFVDRVPEVALRWREIRRTELHLGVHMSAELGGVLGAAGDLLDFLVRGLIFNAVLGPSGWVIVLGHELADLGITAGAKTVFGSIVVAAGQVLLAGPFGVVPALGAGVAAGEVLNELAGIEDRAMDEVEIRFAERLFGQGTIDYSRVRITNLAKEADDGGERAFVVPGLNNVILVNLGKRGFHHPMGFVPPNRFHYTVPGQLFVHELVHAWQLTQRPLLSVMFDMSEDYEYTPGLSAARLVETEWQRARWDSFNLEEQAHIVDDWYEAALRRAAGAREPTPSDVHRVAFDDIAAWDDPAFRFVRDHIRARNP